MVLSVEWPCSVNCSEEVHVPFKPNGSSFPWISNAFTTTSSLRPENIRAAFPLPSVTNTVRFRGRIRHQAFHGATELLQIECPDGLVLTVRIPSAADQQVSEFEFAAADAVPVRESQERP